MTAPVIPDRALILDRCVDRMLAGQPCDDLVAAHDDRELPALVEIARRLIVLAGRVPPRPVERRRRFQSELRRMQSYLRLQASQPGTKVLRPAWLRLIN
jgi:hypothetical protein